MSQTKLNGGHFNSGLRLLSGVVCLLFGLAYIVNVHPVGDGLWFWYAVRIRQGARLYSDMHLSLQPLFVLLTAAFQAMFGLSWLASKILPALQMLVYCWLLYLLSGRIRWPDWARGIVLFAVFILTISGQFYRFDDYHITSDILGMVCIYLLLRLDGESRLAHVLSTSALIGLACGLCVSNRLNDGATLFAASALTAVFLVKQKRPTLILLMSVATAAGLLLVLLLTRDSLAQWATESIVRAARIKGGTGSILLFPLQLPYRLLKSYRHSHALAGIAWFAILLAGVSIFRRFWPLRRQRGAQIVLVATLLGCAASVFLLRTPLRGNVPAEFFSTTASLLLLLGAAMALVRAVQVALGRTLPAWSARELLLLVPAAQLLAGAMTSAIVLPNLTPPVAMAMLILPLALPPILFKRAMWVVATVYLGVALPAAFTKYRHPYNWHHYIDDQMFAGRQWYEHPVYGRMYIENDHLAVMLPMCRTIRESSAPRQLLSLPYPYPNYFCALPPWHNYVQTWYDTSSSETIAGLIAELKNAPPAWIAYQHDLDTMSIHEWAFTHGKPLPHRALEQLISERIAGGIWALESRSCLFGSEWMLIRTAGPSTLVERNLQAGFLKQPTGLCSAPLDLREE